jgi:hypothetical protein
MTNHKLPLGRKDQASSAFSFWEGHLAEKRPATIKALFGMFARVIENRGDIV